jgi:hypothetical protein
MADDVFGVERFGMASPSDLRRRLERRDCSLMAGISTRHGEARVRVINVSAGGIGFTTDPVLALKPGDRFTLRHERLGDLRCIVRWGLHNRYGAEFEPPGRTPAGIQAFYDSLSTGPGKAR